VALLTFDFVGCTNGISGGIKEVGRVLPLLPCNGRGHNSCPGVFIAPLSLYGVCIFNDGIAFDNQQRNEQDASARLVWNTLSKCWDGMKGRHNSSTEGGTGRRVTSMEALNLNNFLSCRLLSRRPTLPPCAIVVPFLTMPPLAVIVPPLAVIVPPLAVTPLATPPAPLLSCHRLSCRTAPLLCWLVIALPCLLLLQCLSRTGWLLNCRLSCRIATSLVAPLPLSSRRLSLFMLSISY
jgi:hypothetical protein